MGNTASSCRPAPINAPRIRRLIRPADVKDNVAKIQYSVRNTHIAIHTKNTKNTKTLKKSKKQIDKKNFYPRLESDLKNILHFMDLFKTSILCDYEEVIEQIDTIVSDKKNRKKRGVVFTNVGTMNRLLGLLPSEVWTNKELKWLDPSAGIGNFFILVYFRLMKTIDIKDEEKRRKHILENMLHFVEINDNYIKIIIQLFCGDKYKLNIHNGSYVTMNILSDNCNIFNSEIIYNIIISNPPYQKPTRNSDKSSSKPLYHLFVHKSLELLAGDGYLLMIHPFTWRRKSKEIRLISDLLQYQIIHLYTDDNFDEFNCSAININYYLLRKVHNINYKTICYTRFNHKDYKSEIHLNRKMCFLPVLLTNETMSIINKITATNENKLNIQLESRFSSHKDIKSANDLTYQYKNYHTYSLRNGDVYRYSRVKHPCHDKHKIIMNFRGGYRIYSPFIDYGTMGITDNSMYLEVNKKNEYDMLNFLRSDLVKFILLVTSYNYASNKKNEFHIMNLISVYPMEAYNLTEVENQYIRDIITSSDKTVNVK